MNNNWQELTDRQNIMATVVRAGRSADRGDWAGCRDCFTDEVFLDHDGGNHAPTNRKVDEVVAEWEDLFSAYSQSLHFVSSFEIEIENEEAKCASLVQSVHMEVSGPSPGRILQSFGSYLDTLTLVAGAWKISRRVYREVAKATLQRHE